MTKKEIRTSIKREKALYSREQLIEMSVPVISKLEQTFEFQKAKCILLYHSLPDEVCTHEAIERWSKQKTIILPVVCSDNLELRRYTKTEDMHTGDFGILEPDNNTITDYSMIDLAVIPGVAFDSSCNRLGRGKGYYDRLLHKLHCPKIGICFKFQYVDSIPAEPHDILMDKIIFG